MRKLFSLFACIVIASASANARQHGEAPAPAASVPAAVPAKPAVEAPKSIVPSIKPNLGSKASSAASAASEAAREAEAEAELQTKIATRLAQLRANQQARAAAAVKQKKMADEKKKKDAIAAIPPPPAHGTHWSYEGESGPANWSKINVDWAKCGTGNRQSPIDLRDGMKVDLEQIVFDYKPSSFSVIDNGHTIQVNLTGGNYITIMNRTYELLQFHFHRPSEERINGKGFEMVVHLVHRDSENKLAVVAVLLERGQAQNVIQTVWNNLPLEKNDVVNPSVVLDLNELLPARRDYFTYMGSLTTPPCSEGVLWLVMKQPVQASPAQMALFSRLYPLNARPIQASAGRVVKESN
jgi:carbonic anhydrase